MSCREGCAAVYGGTKSGVLRAVCCRLWMPCRHSWALCFWELRHSGMLCCYLWTQKCRSWRFSCYYGGEKATLGLSAANYGARAAINGGHAAISGEDLTRHAHVQVIPHSTPAPSAGGASGRNQSRKTTCAVQRVPACALLSLISPWPCAVRDVRS
eukprot:2387463-Rhodomonas_salina.1